MRALVTGAAGFVGRHMCTELAKRGYHVDAVDNAPSFAKHIPPSHNGRIESYYQDAEAWVDGVVADITRYDLIVHCAYVVGGRAAIDGKNMNFAENLRLDATMFEWAVRSQPEARFLYFSSSAAYPVSLQEWEHPFYGFGGDGPENDYRLQELDITLDLSGPMGSMPDSNYGWAKLTGERLAQTARENGLAVTVVRPFSGYGEDQSLDYPFPSIVQRASQGDLNVWGPPGQTRDWIHVSDVVAGSLAVVESETTDPVNLCTGRGVEIGELAQMIYYQSTRPPEGMIGTALYAPTPSYDETKPTGVFYRVGDPTRFNKYYTPKVSLEEGIARALRKQNAVPEEEDSSREKG